MANIDKEERLAIFNSYPQSTRTVFQNRKNEIYDDARAWKLLFAMNLLTHGNVSGDTEKVVTNQSDDDARWLNGVPEEAMKAAMRRK
jgi:hypothetical protein